MECAHRFALFSTFPAGEPRPTAGGHSHAPLHLTKIAQGWPKLWANFRILTGIFIQSVGPSLAVWANPVQFSFIFYRQSLTK
jgi:hypothetical protein